MDLFELVGRLSIEGTDKANEELDGLTGKAEKTGSKFGSIVGGIGKGALAITGAVAGGTAMLVKGVSSSWGELQQSIGGIETLFGEASDRVIENSNNAFRTAGISANQYMQLATSFSASLLQSLEGDTQKACDYTDMAIVDMSDNANKMGTSMESIQNAYQGFAKQNYTMLDNLKLGYGGTKGEMERLLADANEINAQQGIMTNYTIDNLSDVYEAIHVVQQELGITGTTSLEAGETIVGSMGSMSASWQNFMAGLGNPDADMKVLTQNLANSVSGMITNLMPVVDNIASALPDVISSGIESISGMLPSFINTFTDLVFTVISALIKNLPAFISGIQQLAVGLITGLGSTLPTLFEQLPMLFEIGVQLLENIINGFVEGIPTVLPKLLEFIQQFATSLSEKVPEFLNKGFELLSKLVEGIISALPILIAQVPTIISTFANIINDNFPRILLMGVKLVWQLLTGILSVIPDIIANIPQIVSAIVDTIMAFQWLNLGKNIIEFFTNGIKSMSTFVKETGKSVHDDVVTFIQELPSKLLEFGKSCIDNLGTGMMNLVNSLKTRCSNIITSVLNIFKKLPKDIISVGKDIIRGLWNGMGEMTGWLFDKITNLARRMIGKLKDALGVASPSKVARDEVGIFIPQGLAVGIEEDDSPEKAIQNKVATLMDLANGSFAEVELPMSVNDLSFESPMQKYQLEFNAQFNALNDGFERLIALVGNYLPDIAGGMDRNIVLDTNGLVVGMSRKMDTQFGKMAIAKGRGNV